MCVCVGGGGGGELELGGVCLVCSHLFSAPRQYGKVKEVRLTRDKKGRSRGFGYVEFEDEVRCAGIVRRWRCTHQTAVHVCALACLVLRCVPAPLHSAPLHVA